MSDGRPADAQRLHDLERVQQATLNIIEDLGEARERSEDAQRATLNILDDFQREQERMELAQQATLNIIDDLALERTRSEDAQRAAVNILEDFQGERARSETAQRATQNMLEDMAEEHARSERGQLATVNILEDMSVERTRFEEAQLAAVNILDDMSAERRRLEDAQRAAINILDDLDGEKARVDRANQALEKARAELDVRAAALARSNGELEQFAHVVSHDLQEPLRTITGYLQLFQQRMGPAMDPESKRFGDLAAAGAVRMRAMILDLLTYARAGRSDTPPAPTDLNAVLARALLDLEGKANEARATITADPLPTVVGHDSQLVHVFLNLVGNALKFRGEAAPVIRIAARREGPEWVVSVRDNGIGMDADGLKRLFLPFQRLNPKGTYPGTGIGLAYCRKIVERHGGRMWVESSPGSGSTFFFSLPATEVSA